MTPALLIGAVLIVFVVFGVILSRRQSERKREAIADLEREKESLAPVSIQALVDEEVADLGLRSITGAEEISSVVLLKVWKSSSSIIERCSSKDLLRYVVAAGIDPAMASEPDVTLECDGELSPVSDVDEVADTADHVDTATELRANNTEE